MSFDLDQIKLRQFDDKLQVTIFNLDGTVLETCNSVLRVEQKTSVFDQFLFLKSLEDVFLSMPEGEEQRFSEVEWEEGKQGLFHLIFKKLADRESGAVIQWTIIDNTFYYDKLLKLQQSRNDSAISEEFAQIRKRVIEAEKDLLEFKNQELERIQQFKSEFFAKVSHEMRTPLNSITGLADLLERDVQGDYLAALKATSRHLNAIINDILDLSKIESGNLEFESVDFDLSATMKTIAHGFQFACQEKGIVLNMNIPDQAIRLKGDPTRLSQIIYNLMGNSIKFTAQGSVGLSVMSVPLKDNLIQVLFRIADTGIGMDAQSILKILQPYQQASKETSRLYGGTGLGLSIAKQLIENLNGELEIESALGKGTTMSFSLNFPAGESIEESSNQMTESLTGMEVVLAEDDEISMAVLSEQLMHNGANVTQISDGEQLLLALDKTPFDLIISDINLPGKTGIEVFAQLRASGVMTPFIFVSGDTLGKDQVAAESENWDFLLKPVESTTLLASISALHSDRPSIKVDLTKIKSMIDDPEFVLDLLQTILDTLPKELDRLSEMSSKHDIQEARKVLHKIKPSITYLGISSLIHDREKLHEETGKDVLSTTFDLSVREFIAMAHLALQDLKTHL